MSDPSYAACCQTDFACPTDRRQITDAGLEHLTGLANLEFLVLRGAQVTDAGLQHLKGLTSLKSVCLDGTRISDAGLEHLETPEPERTGRVFVGLSVTCRTGFTSLQPFALCCTSRNTEAP